MTGRIHSTESFGTVDGPGIRFVVFFQGCPLRCQYCHNPDTWEFGKGREVTAEELMKEYDSYKEFLKSGGITATGGEPLAQPEFLAELFALAKKKGVHTCLDTSGIVFRPDEHSAVDRVLDNTDLVMLDIKHIDSEKQLKNLKALDVLPYHDMAKPKYAELGISYPLPDTPPLTKEEAIAARGVILSGIKHALRSK